MHARTHTHTLLYQHIYNIRKKEIQEKKKQSRENGMKENTNLVVHMLSQWKHQDPQREEVIMSDRIKL